MIDGKAPTDINMQFKQQQRITDHIRSNMARSAKTSAAILKSMRPTITIISEQNQQAKSSLIDKYTQVESTYLSILKKQALEIQETWKKAMCSVFEQFRKDFNEIYSCIKENLIILGKLGWYFDAEMSMAGLMDIKKAISHDNIDEIEKELVEYFESRLDIIEKSIAVRFPHRAHLIEAAFSAHRKQSYELSIPVLLAQTDGICKERVDQYLFIRKNKKPEIAIYVDQITEDAFKAALLSPLTQMLPINASQCERSSDFNALNRHAVLHGESLDYGNKINSLKAISLINYIAYVLEIEKDNYIQND